MNANITFSDEGEEDCLTVKIGGIAVGTVKIINIWSGGVDVRFGDKIITLPSFVLEDT